MLSQYLPRLSCMERCLLLMLRTSKTLKQICMWTLLLKATPAWISCAVYLNSDWNSGPIRGLYEVNTRSIWMVCPRDGLPWASEARLLHWSWHYWFFLPHLLVLNRHISHHLLYLHYLPFMFLLLVFMSFHFTCTSFHFDDPRSSMFSPMSVKRILNAEGTAFTWMLSTREQFYFIPPVPTSTSACTRSRIFS